MQPAGRWQHPYLSLACTTHHGSTVADHGSPRASATHPPGAPRPRHPTRPLPSPLARPAGLLAAVSLLVTPLAQGSYRYGGALAVWVFAAMILCQYMPDGMTQDSILYYLVRTLSGDLARRRGGGGVGRALGVRGV